MAEIYNNSYPLVEGVTMMTALTGGRICGEEAAAYAAELPWKMPVSPKKPGQSPKVLMD